MGCAFSKRPKATVARALAKRAESQLAKKLERLDVDPTVVLHKKRLVGLASLVEEAADMYSDWSSSAKGTLQLPSLAAWSTEPTFVGGAEAARALHRASAHVFELAMVETSCRKGEAKECAAALRSAEKDLAEAIKRCNAYLHAEVRCDEKRQKSVSAAAAKVKAKLAWDELNARAAASASAPAPAAQTAKAEQAAAAAAKKAQDARIMARKAWEAAEAEAEAASDAHREAQEEARVTKSSALAETPELRAKAEGSIEAGFTALRTGYERYHVTAFAMYDTPDLFEEAFRKYAPKGCAKNSATPEFDAFGGDASEAGEARRAERVKALRAGCESAAKRAASLNKALKSWSKLGLSRVLGPKTHGSRSEAAYMRRSGGPRRRWRSTRRSACGAPC